MKLQQAIDTLAQLHATATGGHAEALAIALTTMEDEQDHRDRELHRAEKHLRLLLGTEPTPDRARTWAFLRSKLKLHRETLETLEHRLGLSTRTTDAS